MRWDRFKKTQHVEEVYSEPVINPNSLSNEGDPIPKNFIDKLIVNYGNNHTVQELYKARWIWFHTLLVFEILFTNILLIAILAVLVAK
jgi:hypothetical protein